MISYPGSLFNFFLTRVICCLADRQINLDDVDGDEDLRAEFSCPYCYEEFDITALCSHLEEEHCFESRAAVSIASN